jgi:hypothetical protein
VRIKVLSYHAESEASLPAMPRVSSLPHLVRRRGTSRVEQHLGSRRSVQPWPLQPKTPGDAVNPATRVSVVPGRASLHTFTGCLLASPPTRASHDQMSAATCYRLPAYNKNARSGKSRRALGGGSDIVTKPQQIHAPPGRVNTARAAGMSRT